MKNCQDWSLMLGPYLNQKCNLEVYPKKFTRRNVPAEMYPRSKLSKCLEEEEEQVK